MLSKEEIEKAKRVINKEKKDFQNELNVELDPIIKDEDRDEPRIAYLVSRIEAIETLLKYIEELEKELDYTTVYMDMDGFYEGKEFYKKKIKNEIEILKAQCRGNPFNIQQTLNAEIRILQELLEE